MASLYGVRLPKFISIQFLIKLQKCVLRLMNFGQYTSSMRFLSLCLLKYYLLICFTSSRCDVNAWWQYNNLTPLNILNLFTSLNTRSSSNNNFDVKHSRLNKQNKSFSRTGARIWNSIPADLCNFSKNKFKKTLHDILFSILIEEEDNVDLPKIMRKLQNTKIK